MLEYLQRVIANNSRQTRNSRELEAQVISLMGEPAYEHVGAYQTFAAEVARLIEGGELIPIKASGVNGRVPPLNDYRK